MLTLAVVLTFGTMIIGLGYLYYEIIKYIIEDHKRNQRIQNKLRFDAIMSQTNLKEIE